MRGLIVRIVQVVGTLGGVVIGIVFRDIINMIPNPWVRTFVAIGIIVLGAQLIELYIWKSKMFEPTDMSARSDMSVSIHHISQGEVVESKHSENGGYAVLREGDELSLLCLACGSRSYNSSDIEHHYCARCKVFYDNLSDVK